MFKSTVFTRFQNPTTPTGGTYKNPIPDDEYTYTEEGEEKTAKIWSDSVPEGVDTIYSSTCTFYGDGNTSGWSEPVKMIDTPDFEIIYSPLEEHNPIPEGFFKNGVDIDAYWLSDANNEGWYDDPVYPDGHEKEGQSFEPVWMATIKRSSGGEWSDGSWAISHIKGEDAITANSNYIENSNFDQYEADEETLKSWIVQNGAVVENAREGYNVFSSTAQHTFLECEVNALRSLGEFTLTFDAYRSDTDLLMTITDYLGIDEDGEPSIGLINVNRVEAVGGYLSYGGYEEGDVSNMTVNITRDTWVTVSVLIKVKATSTNKMRLSFINKDGGVVEISKIKLEFGNTATPYLKAQADFGGPAGRPGVAAYPQGVWDKDVQYTKTTTTAPFVYYEKIEGGKGDNRYYLLIADLAKGEEQSPENDEYWRVFDNYDAIYTNLLMANWALLGSKNGAVFYDKFMFSQMGFTPEGVSEHYGAYSTSMFKDYDIDSEGNAITGTPDYGLSGNFIPNIFLDFKNGVSKFNVTGESAIYVKSYDEPYIVVDPNKGMNYQVDLGSVPEGGFFHRDNTIMVLPDYKDWVNKGIAEGTHLTIVAISNSSYYSSWAYVKNVEPYETDKVHNMYLLVCADNFIVGKKDDYADEDEYDSKYEDYVDDEGRPILPSCKYSDWGNWFIWRGTRAKFLILTPGQQLRCRLVLEGERGVGYNPSCLWYIENSSEFVYDSAVMFPCNRAFVEEYIDNKNGNGADADEFASLGDPRVFALDAYDFCFNSGVRENDKWSLGLLVPQYAFKYIYRKRYERKNKSALKTGHSALDTMGLIVSRLQYSSGDVEYTSRVLCSIDKAAWEKGDEYFETGDYEKQNSN